MPAPLASAIRVIHHRPPAPTRALCCSAGDGERAIGRGSQPKETAMNSRARTVAAAAALVAGSALAAGPNVVSGPGENPGCFKPWDASTKYFQWPAKKGPYRLALANGFVGNTWRIQMIKMAK